MKNETEHGPTLQEPIDDARLCRRPPTATPLSMRSTACKLPIAPPPAKASSPRCKPFRLSVRSSAAATPPPPARIVLFSDGKETQPPNPDNP